MKPIQILMAGAVASLVFLSVFVAENPTKPIPEQTAGDGFAILELFTSEGCSSCPAAEDLLGKVQKAYAGKPVYALAYHVDYWDRMGWKDAFSSPKFTDRQYKYSQWFGSQLYTPQLVANGKQGFVGSDKAQLGATIDAALKGTARIALELHAKVQDNAIIVASQVSGTVPKSKLLVAIVQKHKASKVGNGENSGRTLDHWQIVRKLYTLEATSGENPNRLPLPEGFNTAEWEIIGMLQNQETGIIAAANRASIERIP